MPYIYAGLIVLIFVILNINVQANFHALYDSRDGQLRVQLTVMGRFQSQQTYTAGGMQFIMSRLFAPQTPQQSSSIRMPIGQSMKIISIFLKHLLVRELSWYTVIGTGDAMYTALSTGSMWAVKGILLSYFTSLSTAKKIRVNIQPDFDSQRIYSDLTCIFKLRLVHIMLIAIYIIGFKIRRYINGYRASGKPQPSH